MRLTTLARPYGELLRGAAFMTALALASQAAANESSAVESPDVVEIALDGGIATPFSSLASGRPLLDVFARLPLSFEANAGQVDAAVRYLSRGGRFTLFLTDRDMVLAWRSPTPGRADDRFGEADHDADHNVTKTPHQGQLRILLLGSDSKARPEGVGRLLTESHYLTGSRADRWITGVRHYRQVRYPNVYPGIDLVFHGKRQKLEFDFVVAPGARVEDIRIGFEGAEGLQLDDEGNLIAMTAAGNVVIQAPVVSQPTLAHEASIQGRFVLDANDRIGFQVARYDTREPLIIDPVLTFSTFFGGTGSEATDDTAGIALDDDGNIYITGKSESLDLPTVDPLQPNLGGSTDSFVAKLDPDNAAIIYATYLGGAGEETPRSIAVDASGSAYLVGATSSTDFPTVNAVQSFLGGDRDAFVARLDPTGSSLYYSTYLGGSGIDDGQGVAADALNNAYVIGSTTSNNFPTVNPLQGSNAGKIDVFLVKLNPTGSTVEFSTYLGGSESDPGVDIAVGATGEIFGAGMTSSPDFPTVSAFQPVFGGVGAMSFGDGFVFKVSADGSMLAYSSYLGGSGDDLVQSIAVDPLGNAHVSGATNSLDLPTVNPLQGANAGGIFDGLVAKIDPSGTGLVYSTYLGGDGTEFAHGIAVDALGNAYVTGHTDSPDFPSVDAFQPTLAGSSDGFITKLDAIGSAIVYSSFLGGLVEDRALAVAVDAQGNVALTGDTLSFDFPTQNPSQSLLAGSFDAFAAKIAEPRPEVLLQLVDNGAQIRVLVSVGNAGDQVVDTTMKLWFESALLEDSIPLVSVPLTLPAALPSTNLIDLTLPGGLPFPGTRVGTRLIDPVSGDLWSESLCPVLPCN